MPRIARAAPGGIVYDCLNRGNDRKEMVVAAGTNVIVELPKDQSAYDLLRGDLTAASLVRAGRVLNWRWRQWGDE